MTNSELRVDVSQLLSFFDESDQTASHANAIKLFAGEELAFALLLEYFRRKQIVARRGPSICTIGTPKGPRLDGWLVITNGASDLYYQVEVKTWSRHSFRGRALALAATDDELFEFRKERWQRYWKDGAFADKQLAKVLVPMKKPLAGISVEPLACLWDAVHPMGSCEPFFSVDLPFGSPFAKFNVFSMSGFLRCIPDKMLNLHLPRIKERMDWLFKIFPSASAAGIQA